MAKALVYSLRASREWIRLSQYEGAAGAALILASYNTTDSWIPNPKTNGMIE
jgi:hypothetical protein